MLLRQIFEAKARKVVAVMPGGFHPFHPGHKSLYDWAVKTFGQSNVYVAATNDTKARPFPFEVKKKLAAMAGVPESNFMQVKSPFNNREYAGLLDADTALVFVRSEKDKSEQPLPDQTKKNGEPGYLRSYTGKDLNTSDEMGYMAYGPTINFDFSGMQIKSASELRATWPEMSDEDKLTAAKLMYGNGAEAAVQLLNQALGDSEAPVGESEVVLDKTSLRTYIRDMIIDHINQIDDIKKLSEVLYNLVGKQVKHRGQRFTVTDEDITEILGFATRTPKRNVVKRRPPEPEDDSVRDKLQKRRKLASKVGVDKAFTSKNVDKDLNKYFGK